jgi:apolipoprotein N-acyltransferase
MLLAAESLELPESELAIEAAMISIVLLLHLFTGPSKKSFNFGWKLFVVLSCCWWLTIFRLDGPKISCARDASIIYIKNDLESNHAFYMFL